MGVVMRMSEFFLDPPLLNTMECDMMSHGDEKSYNGI